jgi:hypothetical protein
MINKFTIYGERCSGTNYLENLILMNFDINITWEFGWKHFFGFNDLSNSDDTLFIGIVREPFEWFNSLYRNPHHLPINFKNITNFLNNEIISYNRNNNILISSFNNIDVNGEILDEKNMYNNQKFKNIFELRYIKLKYLLEEMPLKVKHYIFIKYEDLIDNFEETLDKIKNKGLTIKQNINYPINTNLYKKTNKEFKKNNKYYISKKTIFNNKNFHPEIEKKIGYNLDIPNDYKFNKYKRLLLLIK